MDLRIGVSHTAKELDIELPLDADLEALRGDAEAAIAGSTTWWITDRKGRMIGVPGEKVAYIEFGAPEANRRIGFGG